MHTQLKGNTSGTVVRTALMFGADTRSTMNSQANRLEVNEMRMLRGIICGVKKPDTSRNERVRGSVKVAPVTKNITEKRLK